MPIPKPHQLEGATFLAQRKAALLADQPRVGKTGAAIIACDFVFARTILVVTKSSARAQWGREFREWGWVRNVQVIYSGSETVSAEADVVVVGWGMIFRDGLLAQLTARSWAVLILDESHEAKGQLSRRTLAVYHNLVPRSKCVWCLTGTPVPNAPNDLHTMLNALAPERIDRMNYDQFMRRYCVLRKKYVGGQWIEYAIKGKNEEELRDRLTGFWLRRTQKEVGIGEPIYSVLALHIDGRLPQVSDAEVQAVIDAIETGERLDDVQFSTVRRLTGMILVPAIIEAAKDVLDDGLDKLVIMAWHTDVIDALRDGLSSYGVAGIDGRTAPTKRDAEVQAFTGPAKRVFVGQILAAGEAIDLSAACELWLAELSPVPKDLAQAALRITNLEQKRQAFVRVCTLAGSITETLATIVTRKVSSIKQIMENNNAN